MQVGDTWHGQESTTETAPSQAGELLAVGVWWERGSQICSAVFPEEIARTLMDGFIPP